MFGLHCANIGLIRLVCLVVYAKFIYLNFQPLEVLDRGGETQPQVVENYSYFFNLRPNIYKSLWLKIHIIPNNSDLFG